MSRLENYLNIDNIFEDISTILKYKRLNESKVSTKTVETIEKVSHKFGLKAVRTTSLLGYLAQAEEGIVDLFNAICLYLIAPTKQERQETKEMIKQELKGVKKQDISAFLLKLDNTFIGFSSLVRHILSGIFGIEIESYEKWKHDIDYILTNLKKIKEVLIKTDPTDEEIEAIDNLYRIVVQSKNISEDGMAAGGGMGTGSVVGVGSPNFISKGGTTTDKVDKFYNKIGNKPARRKKKRPMADMRHLI
jgi:hypothetical protein